MFFQIKDEVSSFRQKALLASNKLIYYYKFINENLSCLPFVICFKRNFIFKNINTSQEIFIRYFIKSFPIFVQLIFRQTTRQEPINGFLLCSLVFFS